MLSLSRLFLILDNFNKHIFNYFLSSLLSLIIGIRDSKSERETMSTPKEKSRIYLKLPCNPNHSILSTHAHFIS